MSKKFTIADFWLFLALNAVGFGLPLVAMFLDEWLPESFGFISLLAAPVWIGAGLGALFHKPFPGAIGGVVAVVLALAALSYFLHGIGG